MAALTCLHTLEITIEKSLLLSLPFVQSIDEPNNKENKYAKIQEMSEKNNVEGIADLLYIIYTYVQDQMGLYLPLEHMDMFLCENIYIYTKNGYKPI